MRNETAMVVRPFRWRPLPGFLSWNHRPRLAEQPGRLAEAIWRRQLLQAELDRERNERWSPLARPLLNGF
jgi:hypothetical protein